MTDGNRGERLRAAQGCWKAAGLEPKKVHEFRHTLGTMASKSFTPGMVQAIMGHTSRASSEAYFHPNEEMAAEVRKKIIADILKRTDVHELKIGKDGLCECPCCGAKLKPATEPQKGKTVTKKVTELGGNA